MLAFSGTYLIAVTDNFGFLAPVLAPQSPAVLDSTTEYPPVVAKCVAEITRDRPGRVEPLHLERSNRAWSVIFWPRIMA